MSLLEILNLSEEQLAALQRCAHSYGTSAAHLIAAYIDYLVAGGEPILPPVSPRPSVADLGTMAPPGGVFDWLADEPDLYSLDDGEPI